MCLCAEGGGETEGAEEAPGAPEGGSATPPHSSAATWPCAMETPRSAPAGSGGGEFAIGHDGASAGSRKF